jgi:hypothetical protein
MKMHAVWIALTLCTAIILTACGSKTEAPAPATDATPPPAAAPAEAQAVPDQPYPDDVASAGHGPSTSDTPTKHSN